MSLNFHAILQCSNIAISVQEGKEGPYFVGFVDVFQSELDAHEDNFKAWLAWHLSRY